MNISVDGLNICYKITGSGDETVVMLQGWGTDLGVYDSVANAINEKYRFIQFDLPGFGGSDEPKEPWNIDAYADFFIKFMESLDIKKATLIGHSYGGRIIIKLAARESIPFEIKNIVLIDSAGVMPKRSFKQKFNIRKYKIIKKIVSVKLIYALFPELIDDWRSSQGLRKAEKERRILCTNI
ncbi:MAG: alpha/beta hydrolase [Lachnospiraceae bacterium]|nr:alpha/beta hydrolase [Lachnospiraceae bacterium]